MTEILDFFWYQLLVGYKMLTFSTFISFLPHRYSRSLINFRTANLRSLAKGKHGRNRQSAINWWWYCPCVRSQKYPSRRNGRIHKWSKGEMQESWFDFLTLGFCENRGMIFFSSHEIENKLDYHIWSNPRCITKLQVQCLEYRTPFKAGHKFNSFSSISSHKTIN